jgi:hypothetical protein
MHHCTGSGDIEYDLDVALILAKDWWATEAFGEVQLAKARSWGIDPSTLPKVDFLNVYVDKNRDAPEGTALVIQYAFFIDWNKFVEVGFKGDEEFSADFHLSAKIQRVYEAFQRAGLIEEPVGPAPEPEAGEEEQTSELRDGFATFERRASATSEGAPRSGAMWGEQEPEL